jgi:hypothetical protein
VQTWNGFFDNGKVQCFLSFTRRKLELANEKINPTIPLERFPCGFVSSTFNLLEVSTLFPTRKCPKGFLCDVWHKIILKRSCYPKKKMRNKLLIFVKIVENQTLNLWKCIYCPNHWVSIAKYIKSRHTLHTYFSKYWNSEKWNLKLLINLVFLNNI